MRAVKWCAICQRLRRAKIATVVSVVVALIGLLAIPSLAVAGPSNFGILAVTAVPIPYSPGVVTPQVQMVVPGRQATISMHPLPGMQVARVIDNGKDVTADVVNDTLTLDNVRRPHALLVYFKKCGMPAVTQVSPVGGPVGGGNEVTVSGTNFYWVNTVMFGSTPAAGFTVDSPTSLRATAPAGTETVDVCVTTISGTSLVSPSDAYTYYEAPIVTSLAPSNGGTAGGDGVLISGEHLGSASLVTFGDLPAASFTINSDSEIYAVSPAHTCAVVDVRVTTLGGASELTAADQYTFVDKPSVTLLTPRRGPGTGGSTIVITGDQFVGPLRLWFGLIEVTNFTVDNPTQITVPSSPAGIFKGNVVVQNLTGDSEANDQNLFTWVQQPAVAMISPGQGPESGGNTVSIYGLEFIEVQSVKFGGVDATSYTVVGTNQIDAVSPAGTGTVGITVTALGGTSADTLLDDYTYLPRPVVSSLSATSGPTGGGTLLTINGSNLNHGTRVYFGDTEATVILATASWVTVAAPSHSAGQVHVKVVTDGGESAQTAADLFTYIAPPTVTSLSPTHAGRLSRPYVTITGTGFTGVTGVWFGMLPASNITVISPTQLSVRAPLSPIGTTVHVIVDAAGGSSAQTSLDQYRFD